MFFLESLGYLLIIVRFKNFFPIFIINKWWNFLNIRLVENISWWKFKLFFDHTIDIEWESSITL